MTVHTGGRAPAEDSEALGKFLSPASFWGADRVDVSAWIEHGPFAFWLIESLAPALVVELGTHNGFSFLAFCQAVERLSLNSRCFAVDTWKGDVHAGLYDEEVFARLQQYHDQRYATFSKLIRSTFDEAVLHFVDGSIDLLHIDGRHFYEDVRHDFETWLPKLSDRAVVLFHDTNERERGFGVFRLWEELRQRYPHFEFVHGHGLGIMGVGEKIPPRVRALFDASDSLDAANLVRRVYARLGKGIASELAAAIRTNERDRVQYEMETRLTELGQVRNELEFLDMERAQLRAEVNRQRAELTQSGSDREESLARVRELESKTGELAASLAALEHSSSWRVTRPLRALGRLAQALGLR